MVLVISPHLKVYLLDSPRGQSFLNGEVSSSHSDTQQSVVLLWMSDQLVAGNSDITQHTQETDNQARRGIQTRSSGKRAAADPNLRDSVVTRIGV